MTYSFPDLEPVCCTMSVSNCCFLTCLQVSQEAGQVVWYSSLFKTFQQFVVIHKVKGFLFSHSVMFDSLQPHGLYHARLPCPSPTPGACPNSCPSNWQCYSTISSSVIMFSSCLQCFPASGSFRLSCFFPSDIQSIGTSFSFSISPFSEYSGLISFRIHW